MILSRILSIKTRAFGLASLVALTLGSCSDSFIYDDLPECVPEYRVRLSYDHNMSSTEKVHQVEAAEIYAFDVDGNLAATATADKQTLIDNDYTLPIKLNRFETYDLVVWGGLTEESPFKLDGTRSVTSKEDLICRLTTESDDQGNDVSEGELPYLFHGVQSFTFSQEEGTEVQKMGLKKNTNLFTLTISRDDRANLHPGEYQIRIIDANGVINHDNNVSNEKEIHYLPVSTEFGDFSATEGSEQMSSRAPSTPEQRSIFHTSRLMEDSEGVIRIYDNSSADPIAELRLMDMLRFAHGQEAPDMDFQEYLDRADEYEIDMQFHVEEMFMHMEIVVNGWVYVYQDADFN